MRFSQLRQTFSIMFCILTLTSAASCGSGGQGKGSKSEVKSVPEKPIVITGPTKDALGKDIPGAWFSFRLTITNPTDETITIVALELEVTSQGDDGSIKVDKVSFSPTQFNYAPSDTLTCSYTDFGQINPGSGATLLTLSVGGSSPPAGCATIPQFIIGGMSGGPSQNNYKYKVKVRPLGWFGTYAIPTDRFEKTAYFYTQ